MEKSIQCNTNQKKPVVAILYFQIEKTSKKGKLSRKNEEHYIMVKG